MPRFVPRPLAVLALAALPALAGCKEDPLSPEQRVLGEWTLHSMNGGESLPFTVRDEPDLKYEVLGGSIELRGDRTCQEKSVIRTTTSAGVQTSSTDVSCTWDMDGEVATLTFQHKEATAMRVDDLLVVSGGEDIIDWEYRR